MDHFIALPSQLAQILQAYRKKTGLTQKELAEETGLLPKTISLLENHPERSSIENLFRMASFLKLELHLSDKSTEEESRPESEW
ncbi:MAG: hypothetical protein B6241_01030 [Spirochaetaceae bacterium 4572_59]|nr:MAG: hypothetical protein B6241_01030 [Spirochaetaceae bacterium 4572_59]